MTTDDMELVRQYATDQSENAFAALVSRHAGLVYSAALRQTGDPQLAEEITQVVFIILARKAGSLDQKTILPGWLYRAACYTASSARKREQRRQHREQEAYMESTLQAAETDATWKQMSPLLEEAMMRLGQTDRDALVLRFFEGRSLDEVGLALGASEDAAKKRVNRALEKLLKFFTKRGVSSTTAILAGAISANSVQAAPVALAKSVTAVAIAKGAAAGGSTLALVKGALKIMEWTKAKMAIMVSAGVLLAAGTTTVVIERTMEPSIDDSYFDFNSNSEKMRQAPPLLVIRPTHFPQESALSEASDFAHDGKVKMVGRAVSIGWLLQYAYGSPTNSQSWPEKQMVLPANLPTNKFDFLVTVPDFRTGFQARLKSQFGIIGRKEMRDVDVYLLRLKTTDAAGLKRSTNANMSRFPIQTYSFGPDKYIGANRPFPEFTEFLQEALNKLLVDQSGLAGPYDINLKWNAKEADWKQPTYDGLMRALMDQLGLELVPTNMPVEMLVVEKTN